MKGNTVYGMMNIGTNPTVNGKTQSIETDLFDFEDDLYDKKLEIELLISIREEKTFDSIDDLVSAIKEDEVFSKKYINKLSN